MCKILLIFVVKFYFFLEKAPKSNLHIGHSPSSNPTLQSPHTPPLNISPSPWGLGVTVHERRHPDRTFETG